MKIRKKIEHAVASAVFHAFAMIALRQLIKQIDRAKVRGNQIEIDHALAMGRLGREFAKAIGEKSATHRPS